VNFKNNRAFNHIKKNEKFLYLNKRLFNTYNEITKKNGSVFDRTINWQMDYKNFYNNPTHIKLHTPISFKNIFDLYSLKTVYMESGLIKKSWFWRQLPDKIKWFVASLINKETKSIIGLAIRQ